MRKNRCLLRLTLALALTLVLPLILSGPAQAHEFILKPVQLSVQAGAVVPFSAVSAHVFMISEEMEPLDKADVALIQKGKATPLTLAANEVLMTLDGQLTATADGTAVLAGHRKGIIWTNTTKGWVVGSKKGLSGVISSGLYEKFCKTLITVGKADDGYKTKVGQDLEIMPLSNPALAKVGDELEFQFLYQGKPYSPENVLATYDGFTLTPNSFAYFTEPYGEGLAKVKISHPGVWMVRVQHVENKGTDDYDKHVMRSVLVFEVR